MKNNLFANVNYFDTKQLKIIYVLNRIENFAAKHLNLRTREVFHYLFLSNENMPIILKKLFDDFDKKLTIINEFRALRMKNKKFHIF